MKKTVKTVIAILLAIIIACGSVTVFAAAPETIEWEFDWIDDPVVYSYAGKLKVNGTVTVEPDSSGYVYCFLEIEQDGYYKLSSTYNSTDYYRIAESYENGVCRGMIGWISDGEIMADCYYYFEKGTYVLGADFYAQTAEEITVEYLGNTVDYIFDESEFDCLIEHTNFYVDFDENGQERYYFEPNNGMTVEFENGESLVLNYVSMNVYTDGDIDTGEYEVEIGLRTFPHREERTVTVRDVRDIVTKIEITNVEDYFTAKHCYDGNDVFKSLESETLTVTYADGTTEVIENFDGFGILAKNGIRVECYRAVDRDYDLVFVVSVSNAPYIEEKCTVEFATDAENFERFKKLNQENISFAISRVQDHYFNIFRGSSVYETVKNVRNFFARSAAEFTYAVSGIFKNTATYIDYVSRH